MTVSEEPLNEEPTVLSRLLTAALYVAVAAAPFAVTVGSLQIAEQMPGRFRSDHWHELSSWSFIVAGLMMAFLIFRTRMNLTTKIVTSVLLMIAFLFFALIMSMRSNCGDEERYIGERELRGAQVASCQ
jgi:uncharacterized membrane protein